MVGSRLDIACFDKYICGQLAGSWQTSGIALLTAFLVIDLIIPLIFRWAIPGLNLSLQAAFLKDEAWQEKAVNWLKARLLWGFVLYVFYRIFL